MSQGKAKKKLLYQQGDDNDQLLIKDVFTLRDIDTLFDDIDADSDLDVPVCSPLPKSCGGVHQNKSAGPSYSDKKKTPSRKAPKNANGVHDDGLLDKESPFKEIAPINTSSPITLATENDGVRPLADPLLFGEDEEPIGGALGKPTCTQQPDIVKEDINSYSASLESPPERLEFRKTTKPNAGSLSSTKSAKLSRTSVATQSAPLEIKEDSPMNNKELPVPVPNNDERLLRTDQCMDEVEDTRKGSSFQHKLKKALMPKSSCSREQAAAPAPPLVDLEEDFMILDDEAPVRFIIPRKLDVTKNKKTVQVKTSKESVPPELHSTGLSLQSETDVNKQQVPTPRRNKAQAETKKQPKGNRGKVSKKNTEDAVNDVLKERPNPAPDALEDEVCDPISSQTLEGHNDVVSSGVTRKQRSKDKVSDEIPDITEENTDSHQIPAPPAQKTTKKPSKSSGSQQERRRSKTKTEKVLTTTDPQPTNKNVKNVKREVSKTNKRTSKQQKEFEKINPVIVEPSPALDQEVEEQISAKTKQPLAKKNALKDQAKKQKKKEPKRIEAKPKDPPPLAPDTSSDSPVTNKRKRKPPGSWWLSGQDESPTESQSETTSGRAQEPKISKSTPKKAIVEVSEETRSTKPTQKIQKKPKTTRSEVENAKKVIAGVDAKAERKTAKKKGGRKKLKAPASPQVLSPTCVSGDEVGATSDVISPDFCSPNRQHNNIAGGNQVFDKVYTHNSGSAQKQSSANKRTSKQQKDFEKINPVHVEPSPSLDPDVEEQRSAKQGFDKVYKYNSESLQKQPSSLLRRPGNSVTDEVPWKRQRRAPSNWWEVAQNQEPTEEPLSPNPPKFKTKSVTNKEPNAIKSLKTKNHARNIISTPKSIKRSLASMNAIFTSEKVNLVTSGQRRRKQGRRNILHSLEDQSEQSSENMVHSDEGNGRVSSHLIGGIAVEPSATRNQSVRVSSGPNTLSDVDASNAAFRSGPSSVLELQQHDEEDYDINLPSSRVTPYVPRHVPRVLSQCDLCSPPLQTIVLEEDDWNNLQTWFSHLWPPASKEGRTISPDDFHWHSYGGRAMGHAVDLQGSSFSHGKILLGSFMKKPPQMDIDIVSVFSIISSCVRVEIDGVKSIYNSGQVFMIPSGRVYSIHNLCQEPAVLIYHRTQSNDT